MSHVVSSKSFVNKGQHRWLSIVECSPVTQSARVRFPADADIYERRLWREIPTGRPSQPRSTTPLPRLNGTDGRASIRHHVNATERCS